MASTRSSASARLAGNCRHVRKLAPMKVAAGFAAHRLIAGKRLEVQFERIKIIAREGGDQDAAHLIEIAGRLELLDRAAHRKIVDNDLPLVNGALCDSPQFAKLEVVQ